jgi:Zn-dependent protease
MRGLLQSHRIGRILGIEVRITYVLYLLVALFTLSSLLEVGLGAWRTLVSMIFLIGFVFLHEMGHSLAAFKEGVSVRAIYLHPLGGLAQLSDRLPGPLAEIQVALAGPFVSLMLAAIFFLPMYLLYGAIELQSLLGAFFLTNMILAIFNLLPIFPMDGGRVLTAAMVMRLGFERAIPIAARIARAGLVCLGVVGFLILLAGNWHQGIVLMLISIVLYMQGGQEMQARQYAATYAAGGHAYEPWRQSPWQDGDQAQGAWESKAEESGWVRKKVDAWQARQRENKERKSQQLRRDVDEILRKVKEEGVGALTPQERKLLDEASREYRDRSGTH